MIFFRLFTGLFYIAALLAVVAGIFFVIYLVSPTAFWIAFSGFVLFMGWVVGTLIPRRRKRRTG